MIRYAVFGCVVLLALTQAGAQNISLIDEPCGQRRVRIAVTGEASAPPDVARVELAAEATAGNAEDALTQCQSKADAAVAEINALGLEGTEITRDMYRFTSPTTQDSFSMSTPTTAPMGTRTMQRIKVDIPLEAPVDQGALARTIARILQSGNKVGVGIAGGGAGRDYFPRDEDISPVSFVVLDATALYDAALQDAVARAADLKEHLAGLGMKPGALAGVAASEGVSRCGEIWFPGRPDTGSSAVRKEATSRRPEEVVVRRSLALHYELAEE